MNEESYYNKKFKDKEWAKCGGSGLNSGKFLNKDYCREKIVIVIKKIVGGELNERED